ncbi:hypothetical protein AAX08_00430 [Moraxella bovoculi]|nr:hypothetical protein AAX08_00430 [Moraxella bovoculi]
MPKGVESTPLQRHYFKNANWGVYFDLIISIYHTLYKTKEYYSFSFVVSLSNHDENRPAAKLVANGFCGKIQFFLAV